MKEAIESLITVNVTDVLLWMVPGMFIALSRSFIKKGTFPGISKDDIGALVLGSVAYGVLFNVIAGNKSLSTEIVDPGKANARDLIVLVVLPSIVGLLLGYVEATDVIGRGMRRLGVRFPSPEATAWQTMFRELKNGAILLVMMKDGVEVYGRWFGGEFGSASSTDQTMLDLFLCEMGSLDPQGMYVAKTPRRGVYLAADQIRSIEIVVPPLKATTRKTDRLLKLKRFFWKGNRR